MDKFNKELYGQEYWLNDRLLETKLIRKYDEGKAVGSNERNYEIAKKLITNTNTSLEDISKCTGLSLNEVNKLKNKDKKLIRK